MLHPHLDDKRRESFRPNSPVFHKDYPNPISDREITMSWLSYEIQKSDSLRTAKQRIDNYFEDSVLFEKFPELEKLAGKDKNKLLPISIFKSKRKLDDALIYKQHALFLSETIPFQLQTMLIDLINIGQAKGLKIALSHYKIIPLKAYLEPLAKARVRGPNFSDKLITQKLSEANIPTVLRRLGSNSHACAATHWPPSPWTQRTPAMSYRRS